MTPIFPLTTNLHTHTSRCMHAVGQDREYVEAAIRAGIKTLGFSDHCPQPVRTDFVSHIRMPMSQISDYVQSVLALKKEYKEDIDILLGYEAEYFPATFKELMAALTEYPLDYLILGAHYIPDEETGFYAGQPTDSLEDLKYYVDNTIEGLQTGVFSYLAHPDLINFTGNIDDYDREMYRLCTFAKENDIPLEINMNGAACLRHYPSQHFWKLAREAGNTIVVGVDAHDPNAFFDQPTMDRVQKLVDDLGLKVTEATIRKVDFPIR